MGGEREREAGGGKDVCVALYVQSKQLLCCLNRYNMSMCKFGVVVRVSERLI